MSHSSIPNGNDFVDCFWWEKFYPDSSQDQAEFARHIPAGSMVYKDGYHYRYQKERLKREILSLRQLSNIPSATPVGASSHGLVTEPLTYIERPKSDWYWSVPPPVSADDRFGLSNTCVICGSPYQDTRPMRSTMCTNSIPRTYTESQIPVYGVCSDSASCESAFQVLMQHSRHPRMFLFSFPKLSEFVRGREIRFTQSTGVVALGRLDQPYGSVCDGHIPIVCVSGAWHPLRDLLDLNYWMREMCLIRLEYDYLYQKDSKQSLYDLLMLK